MKIALIGATGLVGSKLLDELVARHHPVTAIARHAARIPRSPGVVAKGCDVLNPSDLAEALRGHACVAVAISAKGAENLQDSYLAAFRSVVETVKRLDGPRTMFVGGAGSLQVESGCDYVDTDAFPSRAKPGSLAVREALRLLRMDPDLDWTMLSPSMFVPGTRTGRFRLGGDMLLRDAEGNPAISLEDYAMAFVDEIERPQHRRQRFTVGY